MPSRQKLTPLQKRALRLKRARPRYRKKGRARPMRSLASGYGGINVYRFVRETVPQTATFTMIGAGPSFPQMGYMSFENLQFNQLPSDTDFSSLFARYKVDKIVTTMTPMFDTVTADAGGTITYSPQLELSDRDWETN